MALLKIELLGLFKVTRNGLLVTGFETDAARALLAYLVMHAGTPFSRETLADLLWPTRPISQALGNLRKTLSRLRNAIKDQDADHPLIEVTRDSIQFYADSNYWLDVAAFTDLIATSHQHPHWRLERCPTCLAKLQIAAEMYRGDFLTGLNIDSLPFQEWLTLIREQLFHQVMEILDRLTAHHLQRGAYDAARQLAWRQLELESWCEEAHRQLMRSLALSGQRSAALAQYDTCRQILASQLGVEPSAETMALFEQIRTGNLAGQGPSLSNLPIHLTAFVGRETELKQIVEILQHPDCRLLTLLGLGGMGKTRLAQQVALNEGWMYRDGVYFVPLSGLTSSDHVMTTLARTLQFAPGSTQDLISQVWNYLRRKEMLLVFDGAEHVLTAAQQITELLQHAPYVQVLVTSREPLHVQGEWVYEIDGLAYPQVDHPDSRTDWSAVQLFTYSALRVQPDFSAEEPAISHICQLVEGMPLAIELAAAWVSTLSCHEIAQQIQQDLGFLRSKQHDIPDRHRSLLTTLDSAWALLIPEERETLRRLSVFRNSFDRTAAVAAAAAAPSILAALADKSWLRQEKHGVNATQIRYGLHELVQRYAAEQLAADPEIETHAHDQHSRYYATWLQQRETRLKGDLQRSALQEIDSEIENVHAAWQWSVDRARWDLVERCVESLFFFYDLRSLVQEGAETFATAAERLIDSVSAGRAANERLLGCILARQARLLQRQGRLDQARTLYQQSLELHTRLDARRESAFARTYLGDLYRMTGEYETAYHLLRESVEICTASGDGYLLARALNSLGIIASIRGDYTSAEELYRSSLAIHGDRIGQALALGNLGGIAFLRREYERAKYLYEEGLAIHTEIDNRRDAAMLLTNLADVALASGDMIEAKRLLQRSLTMRRDIGDLIGSVYTLNSLGETTSLLGEPAEASAYYLEALEAALETKAVPLILSVFVGIAAFWHRQGQAEHALELLTFVLNRPITEREFRDRAEQLRSQIELELEPQAAAAVQERGQARQLEEICEEIWIRERRPSRPITG